MKPARAQKPPYCWGSQNNGPLFCKIVVHSFGFFGLEKRTNIMTYYIALPCAASDPQKRRFSHAQATEQATQLIVGSTVVFELRTAMCRHHVRLNLLPIHLEAVP